MGGRSVGVVVAGVLLACGSHQGGGSGGASGDGSGGGSGGGSGQECNTCPSPPGCTNVCSVQQVSPPVTLDGGWTFYGTDQGLSASVWDVSADEGGNAYVAAGDAVYAKAKGARDFARFDPAAAGLTRNCDAAGTVTCPLVSIAGGAPGVALVGLKGIGTDSDADPDWELNSGGADLLAFDPASGKLTRTRHVFIATVPQQITESFCWVHGRRKVRQVLRIAANHLTGTIQYGDFWMAGTHGTFSVLLANAAQRGWQDLTPQWPGFEDAKDVWEHDHPAIVDGVTGKFLTGDSTAIAIDPTTGDPWAANEFRLSTKRGYGSMPNGWNQSQWPPALEWWNPASYLDVWPDTIPSPLPDAFSQYDAFNPAWMDAVASLSFCDDGTLWIASALHGLARRAPDGTLTYLDLPAGLGDNASAVACDPSDGSLWVGFGWGGFGRLKDGAWTIVRPDAPVFATHNPVASIQIDRWSSPRVVWIAHRPSQKFGAGGVTAYDGP